MNFKFYENQGPINIVGAGISGLATAIVLAKAGREVVLHEKSGAIGSRFLGDLQGIDNWSTKEDVLSLFHTFGIETDFHKTPFKEVTLTDGKRFIPSKADEPLFYLVKRGTAEDSLDNALRRQGEAAGVKIEYHSHQKVEEKESSMRVVATGPIKGATAAMDRGVTFRTDHPDIAVGIFGDEYARLGYSYLLITQGYGCICSVVFKDFKTLNPCFEKTLAFVQKHYQIEIKDPHPVGGLGGFVFNHPLERNQKLFVGEAGGLQDMLWGFGIRTAITSGYLAAQAILRRQDYSSLLREMLQNGQKAGVANRFIWEKIKSNSIPLLPYLCYLPISIRTIFRSVYSFSPIHRLLFPSAIEYIAKEYPQCVESINE